MKTSRRRITLAAVLACCLSAGCGLLDPSQAYGIRMELGLAGEKPKNWAYMKELGMRRAPQPGEVAPDFTLETVDGDSMTLSEFQAGRPLVLVFGSFT